jgi:hypothetical protein
MEPQIVAKASWAKGAAKMQSTLDKKKVIREFKERKPLRGTFAVRCTANNRVWVGSSNNLDATKNGLWFSLRIGSYPVKSLQSEWNAHGESEFKFEILEVLEEDMHPLTVADLLKEKKSQWVTRLEASPLY